MLTRVFSLTLMTCFAGALLLATPLMAKPLTVEPGAVNPTRSFAPLVRVVEPAVVAIEVQGVIPGADLSQVPPMLREFFGSDPRLRQPHVLHGEGSGVIISHDGLLLTNHHVIRSAEKIRARFADGRVVDVKLLGSDPSIDIALLQLPKQQSWPYVEIGISSEAQVGDWVVAVGNPLGLGHTVTAGIISGKGRALGHNVYDDFIQTDAAINQGNSGGPLFNLQGQVIGINTAIIQGANTVGFAIPIDMVKNALGDLQTSGRVARGFLGIRTRHLTEELAGMLHAKDVKGVLVAQVYDTTPAMKAGLRAGDIITHVDRKAVSTPADLVRNIGTHRPGESVEITLRRGAQEKNLRLRLSERPREES
jgi:serine protease Do